MRYLALIISFLSHPIWFPIYGAILYLVAAPLHVPVEEMKYTWGLLVTASVVVPTLVYIVLYLLNWLNSPFLVAVEKQKWLLYGYIGVLLVIAFTIVTIERYPILYFYMMNLAVGCFLVAFMHFFRFAGSLSVMLMGGITGFSVFLSLFYHIDLAYVTIFCVFMSGWVASASVYLAQRALWVLLLSWVAGFLPQLVLLRMI
ncbi:hypothetical protein [Capnocytophaga sp.]|uniref:hypothetical protein n=1 Tax=Capnocytophaga sp. TaxID=44737 RepID=UPI0026DAC449|nr:hypothetical protein [Capnocytophaga sp.]MDO5105027.1 hypothetical protein [Capnocytophaga sp.]